MEFVWVPAGEFRMGYELANQGPVTRVAISRGFYLGKYEVTQAEWEAVMGGNPSHFNNCGRDCPVEQVSWEDVQAFIAKLNAMDGRQRYRLPTEAEWEYAARGGDDRASLSLQLRPECDCVVRRQWWRSHAFGGRQGSERIRVARHAGERQ